MTVVEGARSRPNRPPPLEVQVARVEQQSGGFVRVTVSGDALITFVWPGPASHLKFFPPVESEITNDPLGERTAPRPLSRTYTPRSFDVARRELTIDFLLHGDGPAASYARHAQVGDAVRVSTPRARYAIDTEATWLLLAGDDSALPAIATVLESGIGVPTAVVVETVSLASDRPELPAQLHAGPTWVAADPAAPGASLDEALRAWSMPSGRGAIWVACEARAVRRIRNALLTERNLAPEQLVTRGYWRQGSANHPDHDFGEDVLDT